MNELYKQILETVALVPMGKVATYGQIAALAGLPKHARLVGYTLKHLDPHSQIPWHRIVNSQGKISIVGQQIEKNISRSEQRERLIAEGVEVSDYRINLKKYRWLP